MPNPLQPIIKINKILDTIYSEENRFPVDIDYLLMNIHELFQWEDKISQIEQVDIEGFEGALFQNDSLTWSVIFNSEISSEQRIRFTKAHELGHYVLHRNLENRYQCSKASLSANNGSDAESEANQFAAELLMPIADFRHQIEKGFSFECLENLRERYNVSTEALLLRWVKVTDESLVMIVSKDGFMKWAVSSDRAYKAKAFFRTKQQTIEIPKNSLCANTDEEINTSGRPILASIWFENAHKELLLTEYKIYQSNLDKTITILKLPKHETFWDEAEA